MALRRFDPDWPLPRRSAGRRILAGLAAFFLAATPAAAEPAATIHLKIAGGLAGVTQYTRHEEPFWTTRVGALTDGRVQATIAPFDRSGIRSQEMLQFMRLGVVPFGTVGLAVAAGEEPELNAMDLPILNPDIDTLRQSVALWRPRLEEVLRERFGIRLLAIYIYPAQVVFCREPFTSLGDLAGRRVRASSIGQSELLLALGATPVVIPFAAVTEAVRSGMVECAITGTLSGNAIGLHRVTSHLSRQAIGWGVSFFGANLDAWAALPAEVRTQLMAGLATLQDEIWEAAERETALGFACNAGAAGCVPANRGSMVVLDDEPLDRARRVELLRNTVVPNWVGRCGTECAEAWNRHMAPARGIKAVAE
jgi:TRAP-type C4-dicarboxylate transport system substrate-binding protein